MKTEIEELDLGVFQPLLLGMGRVNCTNKETRNACRFGNLTWQEVNR
jgi:hypothetical protein